MRNLPLLAILAISCNVSFAQKSKAAATAPDTADLSMYASLKWRNIGPFRGGRANTISGVINDPLTYYTGYTGGGVWKTDDGGDSWKNISDGYFSVGTIGDIAVSESDPHVLYVGTGEHAVRGVMTSFGNGVYKSTDAGTTWTHIGLDKTRHISDVVIHPSNPDIVLVGAQGPLHGPGEDRGVYKSTDGGKTWKKTLYVDENTGISSLVMDMANPRVLYAAMWQHRRLPWKVESGPNSSVWKSTDMGDTWTRIMDGLPKEMGKIGLSVSRANSNRVFALVESEKSKAGVYRSDDAGKKWNHITDFPLITARSWYYMEIFADPVNPDIVYALNAPVYRSSDGGKTFDDLKVVHGDCHDLWINPKNHKNIALADDGGGGISFNHGKSWSSLNNQPTAQFYRVNADQRMPYWIYGGQQDNLSVCIPSRTNDYGILTTHWYNGPGCESAYIAFDDPANPQVLYGGCYQGSITLMDTRTKESKDIMKYPATNLAVDPKNMKFRFNWNAPLVNSPHDPTVMYHAANVLLKTTDGGMKWEVISPDLTRNDVTRQGPGGGPITNEGAGGENYNTIYYVAESIHEKGMIVTGSDCGKVFITRDGGKAWTDITPAGLPECMIHSIELSPHDPGTIYLSANRYKFNDFSALAFKSTDYGKTWTRINTGITTDDFIKVIREDRKQKGLLYAGSERGFYISFNGGQQWHSFQLNLPVVPVTDLITRDNDLVASTAGRSFWILDDLSPIQQSAGKKMNAPVVFFQPKPVYRIFGPAPFYLVTEASYGKNPPEGVSLDYYLKEKADSGKLAMEIADAQGKIVRRYSNIVSGRTGSAAPVPLPAEKGINRFTWDFRTMPLEEVPNVVIYGADYRGHRVAPGGYKARLSMNGTQAETDIEILPDPRQPGTAATWTAQQQFMEQAETAINEAHRSVIQVRTWKNQLKNYRETLAKNPANADLVKSADELMRKLDAWESNVIETRQKGFQDALNWPSKVNSELFNVRNNVDTHDPRVPDGYQERLRDLLNDWSRYKQEYNNSIVPETNRFNQLCRDRNVGILAGS
jgi:photosystem II stability/assembly factor-like uncharacterized protein